MLSASVFLFWWGGWLLCVNPKVFGDFCFPGTISDAICLLTHSSWSVTGATQSCILMCWLTKLFTVSFIFLSVEKKKKNVCRFSGFCQSLRWRVFSVITFFLIRCPLRKHIHVITHPLRILALRILIDFSNAIVWIASFFNPMLYNSPQPHKLFRNFLGTLIIMNIFRRG